ncbi:MAG: beta-lactamase family protein [Gemmatimonadetes bacterium]|nr:beta-lactamase family protein [Gemmatimonadota bacterium]NNM04198.1 beta-lactamase family protein [Gemmatimonadota bacterium]
MIRLDRSITLLMLFAANSPETAQSQADRLASVLAESDLSGAVIITKGGSTVFSAGYGLANKELDVPNTPETKFRIGSITKQFTAMSILILQDRGLLDVRDPVGDHVAHVPDSWRSLTIHQLLTHTSGIMHSWALPGFEETMAVPTTLDETLERFFDEPLVFEPGTDFVYSGVGYFLLAKTIEVVSGTPYEEFLSSEIFEPLGMRDTGADRPETVLLHRASGYERADSGAAQNAPDIFMPILTGGGNLYSTVQDLARWDRALTERALVSERAYEAMYRPERGGYAYGWRVQQIEGREVLSHSGGVPGFQAVNFRIPAEEIDVVILSNVTPGRWGSVVPELFGILLGESHMSVSF